MNVLVFHHLVLLSLNWSHFVGKFHPKNGGGTLKCVEMKPKKRRCFWTLPFLSYGGKTTQKTAPKHNAGCFNPKVRSMESSSSCFRRRSARQQRTRSEPLCTPKSTPSQLKRNKQCWSNGVLSWHKIDGFRFFVGECCGSCLHGSLAFLGCPKHQITVGRWCPKKGLGLFMLLRFASSGKLSQRFPERTDQVGNVDGIIHQKLRQV